MNAMTSKNGLCFRVTLILQEDTAAFLAGKGFTTFALAFFGAPGLPRCHLSIK